MFEHWYFTSEVIMFSVACGVLIALASAADTKKPLDPPVKKLLKLEKEVGAIDGYYYCSGKEDGGKAYKGICVVTRVREIYVLQWTVGTSTSFTGVGIRKDNTLAVSWAIVNGEKAIRGINVYRIEHGKSGPLLIGRWATLPGPGTQQEETLRFLGPLQKDDD